MFDKFWNFYIDYLLLDNDFSITIIEIWLVILLLLTFFCMVFFKKLGRKRATSIIELFAYDTIPLATSVLFNWCFAAILCIPFFFLGKKLEKLGWEGKIAMKRIDGDVKDLILRNKIIIPNMVLTFAIVQALLFIASNQ
ncbi:MAG: hypothetical protein J1E05_07845 [Eubacterium sp.]|nr:hypothetical protein [Eubacterium sp.]